uniref:Ig-like domain-containing protein n=1 Tax=Nothobranchius furzeri TaxID=105023 RepID=A0A8C6KER6_NOTFU
MFLSQTYFFLKKKASFIDLHWYKQSTGNTLTLMVKQLTDGKPNYEFMFFSCSLQHTCKKVQTFLSLSLTVGFNDLLDIFVCYCLGPSEKGSHTTVIQHTVSDLNRPGDPVTLQCSVFSDSDKKTCSEDLRVFWFRAKSDTSYPDMVYSKGTQHNQCEKKSRNRCVSSMNFSTSDPGTYYCAVATCGQIIFGNGTKVAAGDCIFRFNNKFIGFLSFNTQTLPFLLYAVFVVNITITAVLVCSINKNKCIHCKGNKLLKGLIV